MHNIEKLERLKEKALKLPLVPGVYIMKDKSGKVIYVGKSKVLKNRVSQYFQKGEHDNLKTEKLVNNIEDFEYIITDTEMEALTLENKLIKLHSPKYNIKLKDGKNYPYIKVTVSSEYPRVEFTRTRQNDGAKYFGPYSGAAEVRNIIKNIEKTFGIPSCSRKFPQDIGKGRACIFKDIGQCSGVCTGNVSKAEYDSQIKDAVMFLKGGYNESIKAFKEKMFMASETENYELAAMYRDRIRSLEKLKNNQKVVGAPDVEKDVIALYKDGMSASVAVFYIREGSIVDSESFVFGASEIINEETITPLLVELYTRREYIPKQIDMNIDLAEEDKLLMEKFLSSKAGYKVVIKKPERGDSKKLCDMVYENAAHNAKLYQNESEKDGKVLVKLASMLALEVVPERIEAYDISNIGKEHTTAGMIVVENSKFKKSAYRQFKLDVSSDDYESMRKTLERRIAHFSKDGEFGVMPDLILLDGGAGHVSSVKGVFEKFGVDIPVFGMVKDEYHKTRALCDEKREISIAKEQAVFSFIYRIQEEIHRFTYRQMSNAKRKTYKKSSLEEIDGIGRAKAKALLMKFKSLQSIKNATKEELLSVRGISEKDASAITDYFAHDHNSTKKGNGY